MDSGSLLPHHCGIGDLLAFLIQSPVSFHETWQNDWCRQGNESTMFWDWVIQWTPGSGSIRKSRFEFWIAFGWGFDEVISIGIMQTRAVLERRRRRFWHATHDCVAPYVDIILHRGRFWAKSAASGSVRWWCFRSCWTVLSHVMRGRPSCLLQSAGGEANRHGKIIKHRTRW